MKLAIPMAQTAPILVLPVSYLQVRFFGKFFGLYADYYVFETTLKDAPEAPEAAGAVS